MKTKGTVVVTISIDVEQGTDDPEDGFGYGFEITRVEGLTPEIKALTKWKEKDVLWLIHKELRDE